MSGRTLLARLLLASLAALVVACDDGGAGGEPTAEPDTPEEATATAAPTGAPDIRQEDLPAQPGLQEFVNASGGAADMARTGYADLTEDGVDDAVVPVSSGGEGGDIAVFVFGYQDGELTELLRVMPEDSSLHAETVDGALTITEPVFAEGDPLCCPSQLRRTTYRWDGSELSLADDETVPAEGSE